MSWKTLDPWEKLGTIVVAIIAIVGGIVAASNYLFPAPDVRFTTASRPGPTIEYDPRGRLLQFGFAFTVANNGSAAETLVDVSAGLASKEATILYFSATDIECDAAGAVDLPYALAAGATPSRLYCTAAHRFTRESITRLMDPGSLRLTVDFVGESENKYSLKFCIARTGEFWQDLISSTTRATRVIVDPNDCE